MQARQGGSQTWDGDGGGSMPMGWGGGSPLPHGVSQGAGLTPSLPTEHVDRADDLPDSLSPARHPPVVRGDLHHHGEGVRGQQDPPGTSLPRQQHTDPGGGCPPFPFLALQAQAARTRVQERVLPLPQQPLLSVQTRSSPPSTQTPKPSARSCGPVVLWVQGPGQCERQSGCKHRARLPPLPGTGHDPLWHRLDPPAPGLGWHRCRRERCPRPCTQGHC